MADLTRNNPPPPPQPQPWPPLQLPLHQLSFTYLNTPHHISCMTQISAFFPRLSLNFFKHPSIFPASPQGFTPPPGFASTAPYPDIDSRGAYRFTQFGYGLSGAGSCFFGPYGYLYLVPLQVQLKIYGLLQTRTSMERQGQRNGISPSLPRIVELESRGTGVFHPPDINQGPRNKKRRRKRGKRNKNRAAEESGERRMEEDGLELDPQQQEEEEEECPQPVYEMILPSEWPY